ncbi:hypothetical protein [Sphingobacterium sp. HMA12]|uniref:hypothetical protein n=1 Tax=Sphingobacterium sp. HMA12 TaxID=2050894 RepID=UPI000CE9EC3D|nr:hypothetical protein [Sphingobacterium sp. HMA12]
MKKKYFLIAASTLILLGHSCKKDEFIASESRADTTTLIKAENNPRAGKSIATGDIKYQIGKMRSEAKEAKVPPGDCKFQPSLL